jgi:hypothetical protein
VRLDDRVKDGNKLGPLTGHKGLYHL